MEKLCSPSNSASADRKDPMNKIFDSKEEFIEGYKASIMSLSGKPFEKTSDLDRFTALAKLIAGRARAIQTDTEKRVSTEKKKRVYYFSIEFLIGRLLDNYLLNLGVRDIVKEGLADLGTSTSSANLSPIPRSATAASAVLRRASSTRWPMRASPATATACATATASSSRRS